MKNEYNKTVFCLYFLKTAVSHSHYAALMLLVIKFPGLKWFLEYWKLLALLCGSNFRVKTLERREALSAADAASSD